MITAYDIIKTLVRTEKGTTSNQTGNIFFMLLATRPKIAIRRAVEEIYNVKVEDVQYDGCGWQEKTCTTGTGIYVGLEKSYRDPERRPQDRGYLMGIRTFKPTTNGLRHAALPDFSEITKHKPEKISSFAPERFGGRNSYGRITSRHRGAGHKRMYRRD